MFHFHNMFTAHSSGCKCTFETYNKYENVIHTNTTKTFKKNISIQKYLTNLIISLS